MEQNFHCPTTLHKDGTYTVSASIDFGYITPDDMITLAELAKKHQVSKMAFTTAKRISFMNTPAEQVNELWQDLSQTFGNRLCQFHGKIVACPGQEFCRFAIKDFNNRAIAKNVMEISKKYPMTNLKVGISNCPRNCSMTQIRDIGITAAANGWTLTAGGNGGLKPGVAGVIETGLTEERLFQLVDRLYQYLQENRQRDERAIRTMERIGLQNIKDAILTE